jgi:hypothetical protein
MSEPLTRQEKARLRGLYRRALETPSERLNRLIRYQCRNHGLTKEQWLQLWDQQAGRCKACKLPLDLMAPRSIQVDHDGGCCPYPVGSRGRLRRGYISCGRCVRGLLCPTCNRAVGMLERNPERITQWMDYIRSATSVFA